MGGECMKFILDRAIDTASDRKSRNPWTKNGAEVLEVVSFVVRSSRITVDMLLSLFVLTSPTPLCSPGADFSGSL